MLVKKGKVSVEDDPQARVNVEQIGGLVMLVERDKQNKPVRAFYQLPSDGQRNEDWVFFINYMFMGHYTTPDNLDVVFGPWMPCYSCHEYNVDPGIFGFNYDFDNRILHIIYGNSRVSHGDPSKFSKERMPGEGGAGAIMGPMQWDIIPTVSGLDVNIVGANISPMQGSMMSVFILQLIGETDRLNEAEKYIDRSGAIRKRLKIDWENRAVTETA